MNLLGALSFTTPLALAALLLLPVIWWLLRFTPPEPQTVRFPPLRLLLDLVEGDSCDGWRLTRAGRAKAAALQLEYPA